MGWCGGVGVVVASVCHSSGLTHRTSIPTVVASLTTHDNMFVFMCVHERANVYVHGYIAILTFICACVCIFV